jgi:hypothetical protein
MGQLVRRPRQFGAGISRGQAYWTEGDFDRDPTDVCNVSPLLTNQTDTFVHAVDLKTERSVEQDLIQSISKVGLDI